MKRIRPARIACKLTPRPSHQYHVFEPSYAHTHTHTTTHTVCVTVCACVCVHACVRVSWYMSHTHKCVRSHECGCINLEYAYRTWRRRQIARGPSLHDSTHTPPAIVYRLWVCWRMRKLEGGLNGVVKLMYIGLWSWCCCAQRGQSNTEARTRLRVPLSLRPICQLDR